MKKELPKVFKNNITKTINNNETVFYGNNDRSSTNQKENIDKLFKQNQIYRTKVKIKTSDKTIESKIIGRTSKHLITIDNELIPIDNINSLEIID